MILHSNKEYIKNGDIIVKDLCKVDDVTEVVNQIDNIEDNSKRFLNLLEQTDIPEMNISSKCKEVAC